ncbi:MULTISPECIES: signal peptidase II [Pontibacillus]|uniref:Lipoprotein signal peptidase n=1 Tax=Pontibacillus chungwhensis TaxID=265426 RepID=A0ABY8V4J5_9BACI|nr:signal peptidase II [Pontibacillus chungwhensis]MCD5322226.1 signal peptidase II [Pontibacillus sp. HN14]WIF99520.1 signal peptidase II [Pontibacillus chungwhensis]
MKRIVVILMLVALDIGVKRWMDARLDLDEVIQVIPGWLEWNLLYNEGISGGRLRSVSWVIIPMQVIIISCIFLWWSVPHHSKRLLRNAAFILVLSGGIGNFIDRLFLGHVIDFIHIEGRSGIFNIADLYILFGFIGLAVWTYTSSEDPEYS